MAPDLERRQGWPLSAEDFARVEAVFATVAALDGDTRTQAIGDACPDRPDLQYEIEALLMAHDRLAAGQALDEIDEAASGVGLQVGAYRLVEKIGEGGMGDVYRAERADGLFAQQVAVKITRATIGDSDMRRRFVVERQILASLSHDNIVRLLDGGTTATGQAFLIMEHVEGVPLTQHCRERALSLEDRLQLFCAVCRAVQYAHQHGVVHRDLKPANILVTTDNVPKVVDFGVAKLLEGRAGSGFTTTGMVPGPLTPNYASPEQIRGLPVTTASDVYALGVVLYETVAGVRPYETQGLPLDRMIELVLHEQPPRPSAAPADAGHAPTYAASRLRGDIDAIISKAMSKEPGNRYASASELAGDLTRWLNGEPVLARAPSALYVLRRLAWRHKRVAAALTLACAGVLAASGVATWQWRVAKREQARAEQKFNQVRQLANTVIFKIHDAVLPLQGSTPVRRIIVDEAIGYLEQLGAESEGNIPLQLELSAAHRRIGEILGNTGAANLGDLDGAIKQYERAREMVLPLVSDRAHFDSIAALVNVDLRLSAAYARKEDDARATQFAREAVKYADAAVQRAPDAWKAKDLRARAYFGLAFVVPDSEEIKVWFQTLAEYEGLLASRPDDQDTQRNIGLVEKYLGARLEDDDPDAALKHYARGLELDEKRLTAKPEDPRVQLDTAISYANVATREEGRGRVDEAMSLFEKSLALRRRIATADPQNMQAQERFGYMLARIARSESQRDAAKARSLASEGVELLSSVLKTTKAVSSRELLAAAWFQLGVAEGKLHRQLASCAAYREATALYATISRPVDSTNQRDAKVSAASVAACNSKSATAP